MTGTRAKLDSVSEPKPIAFFSIFSEMNMVRLSSRVLESGKRATSFTITERHCFRCFVCKWLSYFETNVCDVSSLRELMHCRLGE